MNCTEVCKNCGKPIWLDSVPGRSWRHEDMSYDCLPRTRAEPTAKGDRASLTSATEGERDAKPNSPASAMPRKHVCNSSCLNPCLLEGSELIAVTTYDMKVGTSITKRFDDPDFKADSPAGVGAESGLVEKICRAICKVEAIDPDGGEFTAGPNWVQYADAVHQVLLARAESPSTAAERVLPGTEKCPTCGNVRVTGTGEYSCAMCGMGMDEPCEHWKNMMEDAAAEER